MNEERAGEAEAVETRSGSVPVGMPLCPASGLARPFPQAQGPEPVEGPPEGLGDLERRLWTWLDAHHRGRARAVLSEHLQRHLGCTKRELHQALHDLAAAHDVPVASATTGARRGIYLAETLTELSEYRAQLCARLMGLKPRIDALDRMIAARRAADRPRQAMLFNPGGRT